MRPGVFRLTRSPEGKAIGLIALGVGGTAFVITLLAFGIAAHVKQRKASQHESLNSTSRSKCSFPVSSAGDQCPGKCEEVPQALAVKTPAMGLPRVKPAVHVSKTSKLPLNARHYTVAELRLATNNFREDNILGEGSLGSVYKAKFPDGQVFVVKNINMVPLSFHEEDQYMDVVRCTSLLQHPNIVHLVGYCVEQGQHFLVYEHVQDLTLDTALHSKLFLPLTWDLRIQIAVGVAQALNYMHSFSPPVAHCNLKAANILHDDELKPRVCDGGLSVLRPLTSNSVKVKLLLQKEFNTCNYQALQHGGSDNLTVPQLSYHLYL